MARSTVIQLPERVCLSCGLMLEPPRIHEGEGVYFPAPPSWRSPKFLGVRGQTCKECEAAFEEHDAHRALPHFETRIEALMSKVNPDAHRICTEVMAKSHPDVEGQRPGPKIRLDRADLLIRGQNEFFSWRQACFAWHARTYGTGRAYGGGDVLRFSWIVEGYVFPEVSRPLEQRFIDGNQIPRYADGSTDPGPDDPKEHREWLEMNGAYSWRVLQPARLVE